MTYSVLPSGSDLGLLAGNTIGPMVKLGFPCSKRDTAATDISSLCRRE